MAGVVDLIKNYLTTKEGGSGIGMGIEGLARLQEFLADKKIPLTNKDLTDIFSLISKPPEREKFTAEDEGKVIGYGEFAKEGETKPLTISQVPAAIGSFLFEPTAKTMQKVRDEGLTFDEMSPGERLNMAAGAAEFTPLGFAPDVYRLGRAGIKTGVKAIDDLIAPVGVTDTGLSMQIMKMRGTSGPQGISRIKQAQRIKNKAKLQTFLDNNPKFIEEMKTGRMNVSEMIKATDLRNHKGKLIGNHTFVKLFKLTKIDGKKHGLSPQNFIGKKIQPKEAMTPKQDTFLLNVINQRLKAGHPYEGLGGQIQKYIKDNPELLKQAEELGMTNFADSKLQDRYKFITAGKVKNLSEENQSIVNTLNEAKKAAPKKGDWHRLKDSAIKLLSKENQKIALTYTDEIINYAEPSLQSAVKKSTYDGLKKMIARAKTKKVGATDEEILEVLKNVDKEAISKIYQKQGILQNKIKEARELGVTIDDFDDIDLSHIADVANHWKLTMDADNLFFGFKSLNRGDQIKLNNQIDNILSDFPHAKNYAEKRELAKKMITIRKFLEENDLISIVRGKKAGKTDPDDPAFYEKKVKTLEEAIALTWMKKDGGMVGMDYLTRPI